MAPPHLIKHTNAIENIQKFALRICSKKWNYNYREQLDLYKLPALEDCRLFLSLSTSFKIVNGLVFFPSDHLPAPSLSLRCGHGHQYIVPHSRTNHSKYSFMPSCIRIWNNLPSDSVNCRSCTSFKHNTLPFFL